MFSYEAMVVYDASLDEEKIHQQLEEVKSYIMDRQGEVVNIDEWGRRRLAYPIRKKENGYYVVINFAIKDTTLLTGLDRSFRLNEAVLRHMIVRTQPTKQESQTKQLTTEQAGAAETGMRTEAPVSSPETQSQSTPVDSLPTTSSASGEEPGA